MNENQLPQADLDTGLIETGLPVADSCAHQFEGYPALRGCRAKARFRRKPPQRLDPLRFTLAFFRMHEWIVTLACAGRYDRFSRKCRRFLPMRRMAPSVTAICAFGSVSF